MDKIFMIFLSSRVIKKNPFKRLRIKFCLMRAMIMDKIEEPKKIEEEGTDPCLGT